MLQKSDFQAPASQEAVGIIENKPLGEQYLAWLDSAAFPYIAQHGTIQLRLRFDMGEDNSLAPGYLEFYSGDNVQEDRPQLLIEYYQRKINE
jgi:hypothetical protein